jgi:hypothetical protein
LWGIEKQTGIEKKPRIHRQALAQGCCISDSTVDTLHPIIILCGAFVALSPPLPSALGAHQH